MTPRDEWRLRTQHVGRRVLVFDCVSSTNTLAASLSHDPTNHGLAVLADEQTAGRGRLGRRWDCPPTSGVLLSVLLFPPPDLCRPAVLTAWAAVSVCETIRRIAKLEARIKWPNDVLVRGRKVCGILIEQAAANHTPHVVIAGIGLNVAQPAEYFAAAGLPQAASLATWQAHPPTRDKAARALLRQLDKEYGRLRAGDLATLEAGWKNGLGLLGQPVAVTTTQGPCSGRLLDVTWDGVEIATAEGSRLRLRPETVLQLAPVEGLPTPP